MRSIRKIWLPVLTLGVGMMGVGIATPLRGQEDLTRGPYLQSLLADSVRVLWRTETPSIGVVRLHGPDGSTRLVEEQAPDTRHEVRIHGLSPWTVYRYEVLAGDVVLASGDDFRFRTAPATGTGSFRAAITGDSGQREVNGVAQQARVAALIESLEPDLFLHTGDLNYHGDDDIDEVIFTAYANVMRRTALYATRGNHHRIEIPDWYDMFSPPDVLRAIPACEMPLAVCDEDPPQPSEVPSPKTSAFTAFDWGPAHFVFVDSNADFTACSSQMKWVCNALSAARARDVAWLIIVVHEPPYTAGLYSPGENRPPGYTLQSTAMLPPLVDRYGVDLVLSGHDHNYQRSHPIRDGAVVDGWQSPRFASPRGAMYVISGGGGAMLYAELPTSTHRKYINVFHQEHHAVEMEVSPTRLAIRALTPDRVVLDAFAIVKEEPRDTPGFIRGDIAADGEVNLTDAVRLLHILFLGALEPCPPAHAVIADINSSDRVDLADAVYLLNHLYLGGPAPAPPFETCEPLPDFDDTGCTAASCRM